MEFVTKAAQGAAVSRQRQNILFDNNDWAVT